MAGQDFQSKVVERLKRKQEKLEARLSDLALGEKDFSGIFTQIETELEALADELENLVEPTEAQRERLLGRQERLLAKRERLDLKKDLLREKRERLQEAADQLEAEIGRRVSESVIRHFPTPRAPTPPRHDEERRKILEMLQEGKISVDDATRLLQALSQQETQPRAHRKPRWVRIRVTDVDSEKTRVNLTLPLGLFRAALRSGGSIAGIEGLVPEELEGLLSRGEIGHLVDIMDDEDSERVEILLE